MNFHGYLNKDLRCAMSKPLMIIVRPFNVFPKDPKHMEAKDWAKDFEGLLTNLKGFRDTTYPLRCNEPIAFSRTI